MNSEIDFIKNNINIDINKLSLSKNKYKNINIDFCITQISARQKIKDKLPTWYNNYELFMPPNINLEQSSSELTAELKSNLFLGKIAIDLTGGFGIDTYYLSKSFDKVIYIEPNKYLFEIVKYNFDILNINNIEYINLSAEEYINNISDDIDLIYFDPSRRNENKKTFLLEETSPNPIEIIPKIINKSKNILIKISPLFDISELKNRINNITNIYVISVKNECKEVLVNISKHKHILKYSANNYKSNYIWDNFIYNNNEININYDLPQKYIYEPNSSMQKLQCYGAIYDKYKFKKLHQNSHLFTSNELIDFQGRIFEIIGIEKLNKKNISKYLKDNKANISIRNFPINVSEIQNILKIKDGGDIYLIATTNINNKNIILICKKAIPKQEFQ